MPDETQCDIIREAVRAELDARDQRETAKTVEAAVHCILAMLCLGGIAVVLAGTDWLFDRATGFSIIRWVSG